MATVRAILQAPVKAPEQQPAVTDKGAKGKKAAPAPAPAPAPPPVAVPAPDTRDTLGSEGFSLLDDSAVREDQVWYGMIRYNMVWVSLGSR